MVHRLPAPMKMNMNFIFRISEYLFEENIKKKIHLVNFIAILCDGSTDSSVIGQEVLYVIFTDPETSKLTMSFFKVVSPADSQDVPVLVFLFSDGAYVNRGKDSGLIRLLPEDFPWISFIWCFSHRLELALKDALKEFMEPIDTLMHLFYLFKNHLKNNENLKISIIYWKVSLKCIKVFGY